MKEITIRDIARRAGVGTTTVSRVLNGNGYVGAETRKRVENSIQELGFVPSAAARSLPTRKNDVVALVIPELANPFFAKIVAGVMQVLDESGLCLFLNSTDNSSLRDLSALHSIRRFRASGLLYTPAVEYGNDEAREAVRQALRAIGPVVLIDREIEGSGVDGVYSDNEGGAYLCAKALIEAGHRRIGIVNGDMTLKIARDRQAGFRRALREAGLTLREEDVLPGQFDETVAYEATRKRLAAGPLPTAFFAGNNLSSRGFLRAVHEAGLHIPRDVAFIGFDPVDGPNLLGVHFSSLDRDEKKIGSDAARLLLERIENPCMPQNRVILPAALSLTGSERLVPRESGGEIFP